MPDFILNLVADFMFRFLRCIGDTRLRESWKWRSPGYLIKHTWLFTSRWEWDHRFGVKNRVHYVRRPTWMRKRK